MSIYILQNAPNYKDIVLSLTHSNAKKQRNTKGECGGAFQQLQILAMFTPNFSAAMNRLLNRSLYFIPALTRSQI